jgi:photosystem II stability/assembly factor-like uncharacterized protein
MANLTARYAARTAAAALISLTLSCSARKVALLAPPQQPPKQTAPDSDSWREAAEFFQMKRWQGPGDFPVERYFAARDQGRRLPLYSLAGNQPAAKGERDATFGTWQPLGPGNIGGRVRGLAIDPSTPTTMYAGTASGGVWKTINGGQTWTPLTDFLPVLTVSSLVMDPTNSQTLYLGTGEVARGAGIFKSTDGGQTWTQLPQTATSDFWFVYGLSIVGSRPTHLYAATASGIFFSTDAGATWKRALPVSTTSTLDCTSVKVRSDQPTDIVFAACGQFVNGLFTYSVYRNKDAAGSGTWETVQTDPKMSSTVLAFSPTKPDTVYAISVTNDSQSEFRSALLAVYRSTQAGDTGTWVTRATAADPTSVTANILSYPSCPYPAGDHHGQGGYNLDIAVDPTNPDVVFVAGIDLFRSDDGGATWGYADGGNRNYAHSDQHTLVFHPGYDGSANQTLFVGNDGGLYRTDIARGVAVTGTQALCGSGNAIGWTSLNNGFAATQFYHGAVFPGGATYFGGTQDNGTPLGTDSTGINKWFEVYGGDGGQVAVDPVDPNNMFYEYINLSIRKSTDGALTNRGAVNGITEDPKDFQFINFFALDMQDPLKMYTGAKQLWRSLDGAENWSAASGPVVNTNQFTDTISAIAVDPKDSNHILFGTSTGGNIYRNSAALTSDGKTTWAFSQPRSGYVSRIAFDPNQANTVYATYSTFRGSSSQSQIYRSGDAGVSWAPIGNLGSSPLPDIPAHVLLVDPDDSNRLYVGTDTGVFASLDAGQTWVRDDTPFADAITETLTLERDGSAKYLYAFTFGRGVWRVNLSGSASCSYSLSTTSATVDSNEQYGSLNVTTDPSCTWSARPGSSFVSIQSPATGKGPGTVFYRVKYNPNSASRTDNFFVQNQPVSVNQTGDTAGSHNVKNDELTSAKVINSLPYGDQTNNTGYTQNVTDPIHTCTKSANNKTQWWKYTASTGNPGARVIVAASSRSLSTAGDAGIVISAYPLQGAALGNELACTLVPAGTVTDLATGVIQFDTTPGAAYAIEISGVNSDNALTDMTASVFPLVSLTPAAPALVASQKQQFSASVLNSPNTAVRWFLSAPIGTLDTS